MCLSQCLVVSQIRSSRDDQTSTLIFSFSLYRRANMPNVFAAITRALYGILALLARDFAERLSAAPLLLAGSLAITQLALIVNQVEPTPSLLTSYADTSSSLDAFEDALESPTTSPVQLEDAEEADQDEMAEASVQSGHRDDGSLERAAYNLRNAPWVPIVTAAALIGGAALLGQGSYAIIATACLRRQYDDSLSLTRLSLSLSKRPREVRSFAGVSTYNVIDSKARRRRSSKSKRSPVALFSVVS